MYDNCAKDTDLLIHKQSFSVEQKELATAKELQIKDARVLPIEIEGSPYLQSLSISSPPIVGYTNKRGGIRTLVPILHTLSCLKELALCGLQLSDNMLLLRNTFRQLKSLTLSEISEVDWTFLQELSQLEILELDNLSSLTSLSFLKSMTKLKELGLIDLGNVESLTEIENLESLVVLDIRWMWSVKSNSLSINKLTKLETLVISLLDHLFSLPEEIGDLHSLKILDLSHLMHLKSLPESLGKLQNLEELRFIFPKIALQNKEEYSLLNQDIANTIIKLSGLKELILDNVPEEFKGPILASAKDLPQLTKLEINDEKQVLDQHKKVKAANSDF